VLGLANRYQFGLFHDHDGGSAIAVFGEQGKWRPSEDIVSRTREGVETLVRLGETIGMRI
jgi:hypothetical protein